MTAARAGRVSKSEPLPYDLSALLAGFPESRFAWRKVIPQLALNFKVIAIDLPGQGDSDPPLDGYDTQASATKVHGLLDQLKIDRYFMAGHDEGAWVAYTPTPCSWRRGETTRVVRCRHPRHYAS